MTETREEATFIALCPGGCHKGRPGQRVPIPTGYPMAHWRCQDCGRWVTSFYVGAELARSALTDKTREKEDE